MNRLSIALLIMIMLTATGCFNSESEYERLVEEKNELAQQLAQAQEENLLLAQALANVNAEQERLQETLNTERRRLASGALPLPEGMATATSAGDDIWVEAPTRAATRVETTPPATSVETAPPATTREETTTPTGSAQATARLTPPASSSESGSSRVYIVQSGDVLYTIASKNNTTVDKILELNPHIRNRPNHVLQIKDKINLP